MRAARLFAAVVLTAGAVPAGLATTSGCAGAEPAGSVAVAVDFGDLSPAEPSLVCVPVEEGMTGADVLAARAEVLGTEPPRYDAAGLLCAVDGLPAQGCGEPTGDGGYRYWAYSLGTGDTWAHADLGPAFRDAEPATVEGWRFVSGAGDTSDPPPRAPADADEVCAAAAASRPEGDGEAGDDDDGDFPLGTVAGAALVVVLAAAAAVTARRRRP